VKIFGNRLRGFEGSAYSSKYKTANFRFADKPAIKNTPSKLPSSEDKNNRENAEVGMSHHPL